MSIEKIQMPGLGESVHEATITLWLVKPGDEIKKYDPIAEVVSDKVTSEIPSNFDGVVKELLVEADQEVPIGTDILSIEVAGGASEPTPEAKAAPAEPSVAASEAPKAATPVASKEKTGGARYSPVVMRLAQEKGIDLAQVTGTGHGGRITKKDLLNFDPAATPTKAPVETATVSATATAPAPTASAPTQAAATQAARPAPVPTTDRDEVVPADGVRKAIAKKMVQSVTEIPHAWLMVEADVSNLVTLRNEAKDNFKKTEGVPLSFFPFFIKAVVQALKNNPKLNTSWDNGNIIYHKDINISIAVAGEENLFVPVIKNADQLSVTGIAKEAKRLADAVHQGSLSNSEMQGGTFTVNNTGTFGSVQSMGIINYPQAAILQVEGITKRVVPTKDGGFKTADMVNLCLSIDHRILDGLQAGRFLNDIKENLAKFDSVSQLY